MSSNAQARRLQPGDLVKKRRHEESQAGLVLETGVRNTSQVMGDYPEERPGGITFTGDTGIRIMWETGTATIEIEDELELVATNRDRGKYLVGGKEYE